MNKLFGIIPLNPITAQKLARFKSIKRGYCSFILLAFFCFLALLGPLLVGNRALAVRYQGEWFFPVFSGFHSGKTFGQDFNYEADYRQLKRVFEAAGEGNKVILPLVPFNGTEVADVIDLMPMENGLYMDPAIGKPFKDTKGITLYGNGRVHRMYTIRDGRLDGPFKGYSANGDIIERGLFKMGEVASYRPLSDTLPKTFSDPELNRLHYQMGTPSRPGMAGHVLGTDEPGRDVLARAFEGFKIVILASIIYVFATFFVGISVGCAMGYFGGLFDMLFQRFIEIWSSVPFLYVVIIISTLVTPSFASLMGIIVAFSWMGMTYFMRTATYREKERDYVAAARLLGASPARIIFKHILPNAVSTVVTFVPFLVAGIIGALTSLDFLGFGLPPTDPSWGEMLKQGSENHESHWILYTVVVCLISVLVLVTFIGEAIREAYDPKKYTVYE